MKKNLSLFLMLFVAALLSAVPATAQNTRPVFKKWTFSSNGMVQRLSDNGEWGVAQAAYGEAAASGRVALLNVSSGDITYLQTQEDLEQNGACSVSDVTDDGSIVVGSYRGIPAYWSKSTDSWTTLPLPASGGGGSVTAVTPDGKYAVGTIYDSRDEYQSVGMMWDLTTGTIVELTNLPKKDMTHQEQNQHSFVGLSADGRYIVARMSFSYVQPAALCTYLYDVQNQSYKMIGFDPSDTSDWTPWVAGMYFTDNPVISPNGKWVAALVYTENDIQVSCLYNTETGEFTLYNESEDNDMSVSAVDDSGLIFAATPSGNPLREWYVRHGNYWYAIRSILTQHYGMSYENQTQYDNTGTVMSVSADGKSIVSMVDPNYGEGYVMILPESLTDVCAGINLLGNYTVNPANGSSFTRMRQVEISFDRNVQVLAERTSIELKGDNGAVYNSNDFMVSETDPKSVIISFRTRSLEDGVKYTMTIPAGSICVEGDRNNVNEEINLEYTGRADQPVSVTNIYPEDNSELAKIDNSSNPVLVTFDADVVVAENASAELIRTTDNVKICDMNIMASGNRIAVYPAATQYLYKGNNYKVVVKAGAVTDLTNSGANQELTINYTGTYERQISSDNTTLFTEDFDNISQALANMMRYEGDHNTPTSEMAAWEFDADNQPWNFSIRDDNSTDICAASHSMYTPAGKSDDWMVIPQLEIPDTYCTLSFDAQSYRNSKSDMLKVLIWTSEENVNTLTTATVNRMKEEGKVVFNEKLSPGSSETELAGDWTHYTVDLSEYNGKKIYIAFVNENEDQSIVFVDNIKVERALKYLLSLNSDESVVNKTEQAISGTLTANADNETFSTVALTLLDAQGNELETVSESGLAMKKGDAYQFAFNNALPLTSGEINNFSIRIQLDDYTDVVSNRIKNLTFAPTKRVILEEMTGINCVNCPKGILAIERLNELYGEQFIPISIHTYEGDPYGTGLSEYTSSLGLVGAPTGKVNRSEEVLYPMGEDPETLSWVFTYNNELWGDHVASEMETPADVEISASVDLDEDNNTFSVPVKVRSALKANNLNLNLFLVVMEDGIISYQTNNLGGVSDPALGEWGLGGRYSQSMVYNITHNDVVRGYYGGVNGTSGFFPQSMNAGQEYDAIVEDMTIPGAITDLGKAKVAVILIDGNTDKVVNAVCAKFPGYTGIQNVTDNNAKAPAISYGNGNVTVTTDGDAMVSLYTTTGTLIGSAKGNGSVSVSTGGYNGVVIVKAACGNNTTVKKFFVK